MKNLPLTLVSAGTTAAIFFGGWVLVNRSRSAEDSQTPYAAPVFSNVTSPEERRLSPVHPSPVFSPDSRLVAAYAGDSLSPLLEVRDTSGRVLAHTPVDKSAIAHLSWSPDSKRIVAANYNAQVWKVRKSAGMVRLTPIVTFPGTKPGLEKMPSSVSSSSSVSIVPSKPPTLPETTPKLRPTTSLQASDQIEDTRVSAFHQLGAHLMYRPGGPVYHHVELFNPRTLKATKVLCNLLYPPRDSNTFSFSPQGKPLGIVRQSYDGLSWQLAVWDLKSGRRLWERTYPGGRVYGNWSPDGKFVVVSGSEATHRMAVTPVHHPIEVVDALTGRPVSKIEAQATNWVTQVTRVGVWTYGTEKDGRHSLRFADWSGKHSVKYSNVGPGGILFPHDVAASPDGNHFIMADWSNGFLHWRMTDLKTGKTTPERWRPQYHNEEFEG